VHELLIGARRGSWPDKVTARSVNKRARWWTWRERGKTRVLVVEAQNLQQEVDYFDFVLVFYVLVECPRIPAFF